MQDEKPSADAQNEHGTQQAEPLGGNAPIPSVLEVLLAQANAMSEMAKTMGDMLALNHELMERLLPGDEDPDEDDPGAPHGRDMSGKPVKVS